MKCTVCSHSQCLDIDQALLAGNATFAALSQQYGLSVSALFRHKKLLKLKMARVEKDLAHNLRQSTLFQFNDFLEQTRHLARTAGADGNIRQALQAVGAGTRILNFITKLDVQLDQNTVYRVLASPQWTTQDSLLPTDPRIITDAHQALADDLFFSCPELPAALEDVLKEEEQSELLPLETSNPGLEIRAKFQRETSAKLPKKIPPSEKFIEQYKSARSGENNLAQNSVVGRESLAPPAAKQPGPQTMEPHAQKDDPRPTEIGTMATVFASPAPPIVATASAQPVLAKASPLPGSTLSAGVGPLRLDLSPDLPPKTVHQKSETLTAKLKTYCQRWPKLVSSPNRKPKTNQRLLPNLITGLNSWFQSLATKCRPDPPPAPYEEEWEVLRIQKSPRRYKGIYY